jgi:hypothetical protein
MCDYSLQTVRSRPARVGDKITTRDFAGHAVLLRRKMRTRQFVFSREQNLLLQRR